jgi:hypothetical protein
MAAITLDQYVTRIEESPIELHGGKKRALTDAEKLLLVQQDELRRLRENGKASSTAPSQTQPPAPAPLSFTPTLPSVPAPAPELDVKTLQPLQSREATAVVQESEPGSGFGGAGNLLGIVAAGVLGGLLYRSNKSAEQTKQEFEGQLAGRDEVLVQFCHDLNQGHHCTP